MNSSLKQFGLVLALLGFVSFIPFSCTDEDEEDPAALLLLLANVQATNSFSEEDMQSVVDNYVDNVILPIYRNLGTAGETLNTATEALEASATADNLTAARDAWKAARVHWENSEAFLFGPVDTNGYDPRIDSWPLDKTDLDNAISDGNTNIPSLSDSVRGFHTVEYLLFDDGSGDGDATTAETLANLGSDKLEFLAALTGDIELVSGELVDSWEETGDDYATTFKTAGTSSNTAYPSLKSAIEEMIRGMDTIVDEVRAGKIGDPYTEQDVELVESRYAHNSLVDFANNIKGVQIVWTGDYSSNTGTGLDELIATVNPTLSERITDEIQAAIDAIEAIEGPFRDAITQDRTSVSAAIDALATLHDSLDEDLIPLFDTN